MDSILEGAEQLERELTPDPVAAPATGSIVLHAALFGAILAYGLINGFMHQQLLGRSRPRQCYSGDPHLKCPALAGRPAEKRQRSSI